MRLITSLLIFTFVFASDCFAQKTSRRSTQVAPTGISRLTAATTAKRRVSKKRDEPYYQLGTGLVMWQEPIPATKNGVSSDLVTQSLGAKIGMTYNKFFEKSRWRRAYSADASFGTVKGKSFNPAIPDELNKQPWLATTATAGWTYRTAPASEVGVFFPVVFRYIKWDLNEGATLKMERGTSFSAGMGGVYTNRFSTKQALNISVTHQQIWHATLWAISWEQTL